MTSPLRYPGGKTRACKLLWAFLEKEYPSAHTLVSPFLGGGSFELMCASRGLTVHANDAFEPLATFWTTLKTHPIELTQAVELLRPLSKAEFYRLRESIRVETDPILKSAYYFAINRCSFSGSTFCGGYSEEAAEKRFTESSIERLRMTNLTNITCSNLDWEAFLDRHPPSESQVVYLDPPYMIQNYLYGRDGDLHAAFDHTRLANALKKRYDWVLCYNDSVEIRKLYSNCRIQKVSWTYGMNTTKESNEILILPPARVEI